MTDPDGACFERYLDAKRTVDERARNERVSGRFRAALSETAGEVRVVEMGAGTGALAERALEWAPDAAVRYTAVEADPALAAAAVGNVADRARAVGRLRERTDRTVVVERPGGTFAVEFVAADAFEVLADRERPLDAVVGQAFVDLADVRATVEAVFDALRPGGLAYFPITFDGVTALLPRVAPELDDLIETRYHRHMDETEKAGGETGDSRAGRRLLTAVPAAGGEVLAAGGSDWVVTPDGGGYPADEAYFLHHVVDTVQGALSGDADGRIDDDRLERWARRRHEQVAAGELRYVAHNLDVLASAPGDDPG